MPRCYIFGIGGTGARIIRSLTFLLASGSGYESLKNWELVPMLIDLDAQNGDLENCKKVLENYVDIEDLIRGEGFNRFFRTKIRRLSDVAECVSKGFTIPINLTNQSSLVEMIDFHHLPDVDSQLETEHLIKMLFSEEELEMTLEKGFKGHPNIGTVVFGQLAARNTESGTEVFENEDFKAFSNAVTQYDRVFIVGSIFGGTGAAGLPRLLKEFRSSNIAPNLRNSKIGILSVMPYFKVSKDEKSKIDSNGFITRTKAALRYYSNKLNEADAIYHIGDTDTSTEYLNSEGGEKQRNKAHFVELLGATSIIDFIERQDDALAARQSYRYGLRVPSTEIRPINLINFKQQTPSYQRINRPLTQFYLFSIMVSKVLNKMSNHITWAVDTGLIIKTWSFLGSRLDTTFFGPGFYSDLEDFVAHFNQWNKEMADDDHNASQRFSPFKINPSVGLRKLDDESTDWINGIIEGNGINEFLQDIVKEDNRNGTNTIWHTQSRIEYARLVKEMDRAIGKAKAIRIPNNEAAEKAQRFMEMAYISTKAFLDDYNVFK